MSKPKQSTKVERRIDDGKTHVLDQLFEGPKAEMPELKSVGVAKLQGTNTWIDYVITTRGKEVLSIEVGEPNLRQIVEDTAKINFVEQFMSVEA